MTYQIAAFYRFVALQNLPDLRAKLRTELSALGLNGTLLLAPEGINGTLAGSCQAIDALIGTLNRVVGLARDTVKFSNAEEKPFKRLKIRLKREIITFHQPTADPTKCVGTYVDVDKWNTLLNEPDVLVIDTRNRYESEIGTFEGAHIPSIDTFTQFSDYVRANLDPAKHKKIAMYCTGGIRCEKASSFMLAEGFPEVYHLNGGILKYLELVPPAESKWRGECFVFDERVAVEHGLKVAKPSVSRSDQPAAA